MPDSKSGGEGREGVRVGRAGREQEHSSPCAGCADTLPRAPGRAPRRRRSGCCRSRSLLGPDRGAVRPDHHVARLPGEERGRARTAQLVDQVAGGGRLAGVDVADNHDVDMAGPGRAAEQVVSGGGQRRRKVGVGGGQQHKAGGAALPSRGPPHNRATPGEAAWHQPRAVGGAALWAAAGAARGGWLCARATARLGAAVAPPPPPRSRPARPAVSGSRACAAERLRRGWRGLPARREGVPGKGLGQ